MGNQISRIKTKKTMKMNNICETCFNYYHGNGSFCSEECESWFVNHYIRLVDVSLKPQTIK